MAGGGGGRKSGGSARAASGDATASCSGVGSFLLSLMIITLFLKNLFRLQYHNFCAISVHRSRIFRFKNSEFDRNAPCARVVLCILSCIGQGSKAASASDKLPSRVPCSRGPDDEMSLSPSLFAYFFAALVACSAGAMGHGWFPPCLGCILRLCSNGVLVSWFQDCFRWCLNPDGSSDLVFVFPLQDDTSTGSGKREGARRCSMRQYRSQLEQEVSAFLLSWFINSTILNFVDCGFKLNEFRLFRVALFDCSC